MSYNVRLTSQAKQDLRDTYEYIANTLLEPRTANSLVRRIINVLRSLEEMPGRFPLYQEEPWRSRGLHRINIENYSGFYFITGNDVEIIRIMYSGRDIANLLE